jgi:hypothetical protein
MKCHVTPFELALVLVSDFDPDSVADSNISRKLGSSPKLDRYSNCGLIVLQEASGSDQLL